MAAPQEKDQGGEGGLPPGMHVVEGVIVPAIPGTASQDPQAHFGALLDLELRPDDVLVCAIPKAGTHWVWEMTSMLTQGRAESQACAKETVMLEFVSTEKIRNMASPRVLNTHVPFRLLPRQVLAKKTKLVYVSRNPKDVAVSTYHHVSGMKPPFSFQGSFSDFLTTRFLANLPQCMLDWFWMTKDWEEVLEKHSDHPILHLCYEDMKEDPVREVRRLAEFLGLGGDEALVRAVADKCSFSSMRKAEASQENPLVDFFNEGYTMYRKGQVGDWKNWFTVANNELFDKVYAERMAGSKRTYRYTL